MSERQISPEVYILLETDVSNSLMGSFIFCVSTQNLEKKFYYFIHCGTATESRTSWKGGREKGRTILII